MPTQMIIVISFEIRKPLRRSNGCIGCVPSQVIYNYLKLAQSVLYLPSEDEVAPAMMKSS
jgi:hypothetical protein